MITYELKCKDCGKTNIIEQSILKDLPKKCDECGGQLKQIYGDVDHLYFTEHRGARTPRFK